MGEKQVFQPLTGEDRITVLIYRGGIVLSAATMAVLAVMVMKGYAVRGAGGDVLLYGLQISTGLSVFFIHLYVGKFKIYLMNLYYVSLACLAALLYLGKGSPAGALLQAPASALLLLPLSGCLGFVTAKEAFCFRLFEGYLLAMIMPLYLLLVAAGTAGPAGLVVIAAMFVLFTLRKVFMPIAYDIGDKTAYH